MKKLIFALLIGSLLLLSLCACNQSNSNESTTPESTTESVEPDTTTPEGTTSANSPDETTTPDNNQDDQPQAEGELDKSSDLIVTLVAYLDEFWIEYEIGEKTLANQIDDIKNGAQPLHVAFDPENYYYVCGYYNGSHKDENYDWCCSGEYIWKRYDTETEIQEYYNGMKCVVVFQMNKALTVTNILSNEIKTPDIEHFQILHNPTFENGVNTKAPILYDGDFVLLNDEDKDVVYYTQKTAFHSLKIMPFVILDDQYYICTWLATLYGEEEFDLQQALSRASTVYDFGEYYDAIVAVMDADKYTATSTDGKYVYRYGLISSDDFANYVILGKVKVGEELDKDSDLIQFLLDCVDNIYVEIEPREEILAENIDLIRGGAQPLYVTFDPESYYYVCGYCYEDDFGSFEHYEEYTWIKYDAETEIQEYYNGMNWCVVFQINKALTVTNILSDQIETPDMEYVNFFNPKFENGVNAEAPIWFNGTFTLLGDEDKDVIYYTREVTSQPLHYLVWDIIDGQYYVSIGKLGTFKNEEDFNLQEALSKERHHFGEYFDAIVAVMDVKTTITSNGLIAYHGVISREDFANIVLGNYRAEGELDKDSQIIRTLTQYLIWYGVEGERLTSDFPSQIDHIKEGIQAVHAVFDPSEYYFVCGYYNPTHEYEERNYCCAVSYTWIKYENETEIQEYYNGMKCVVAFQLNESLTVTDILSADADVPHMEYFQLYEPTFKDETNTEAPIIFDGTFIYINGFEKDAVYYCISDYYNAMSLYYREHMLIPCEYIERQYYIPIQLISLEPGEIFNLQDVLSDSRFEKAFGEYYDAIIKAINTEKWYEFSTSNEKIHYYGLISIDDFVNSVVK